MTATNYAVVGGGIVGASVAYHLSERTDDPVVVYERDELAGATTFESTSMVGVGGPDPHYRMKRYGFRLYNELLADPETGVEHRQSGRLRVTTDPEAASRLRALDAHGTDGPAGADGGADDSADAAGEADDEEWRGIDARKFAHDLTRYLPGDDIGGSLLVPPLATERVEGALYRPMYGHIRSDDRTLGPRDLAFEFVERARENGVTFETDAEVTGIETSGGAVSGVEVDGGRVEPADAAVCAAGPWNAELAATAGVELPVEHTLSPVYVLEPAEPLPYTLPTIKSHESSVGVHRKRDDRVLVTYTPSEDEGETTYDPDAVGEPELAAFRETALEWAERLVPRLGDATLVDEWVGVGTNTPDGNPIVGWTGVEGLSLAATMIGIQLAPAVGDVVARQLVEEDPTDYYEAVSLSRFDGHDDGRDPDL